MITNELPRCYESHCITTTRPNNSGSTDLRFGFFRQTLVFRRSCQVLDTSAFGTRLPPTSRPVTLTVTTNSLVHASTGKPSSLLHATNTNRLVVPQVKLSTVGSRAFAVAAPDIWNRLPTDVVAANSLSTFRRLLKRFFLF